MSYHLDLKKYPKNISHFLGVGDDFSYNENKMQLTKKYIYINVHHVNIEVIEKKPNTCKKFHLVSST